MMFKKDHLSKARSIYDQYFITYIQLTYEAIFQIKLKDTITSRLSSTTL